MHDTGMRPRASNDGGDDQNPWRISDGTPRMGRVECIDRAGRRTEGNGGTMTWAQIGHSDDIVRWRPMLSLYGMRGYGPKG